MNGKAVSAENIPRGSLLPSRVLVFLVQILGLAVAGWFYQEALNPDAIAYLRLAHYYADGPRELAVSGNWGPMLSWLLAPLLKAGVAPLTAARVLMGLSAVWFLWASTILFRVYALPPSIAGLCTALVAAVTIPWSVENITPDLLVGGFICLGVAALSNPSWLTSKRHAVLAGVIWGAAYLAKAIGFPLAWLATAAFAVLWKLSTRPSWRTVVRAAGLTLLAFAMVVSPWVTVLSMKCGQFTFTTTPRMMRAEGIPSWTEQFQTPPPGRLTVWEDPTLGAEFAWSPFSSWSNALRQVRQSVVSLAKTQFVLTSLYVVWPLLLAAIAVALFRCRCRTRVLPERFGWPLVPVLLLTCLHLAQDLSISAHRYFFAAVPFLLVASVQLARVGPGLRPRLLVWGMTLSALVPAFGRWAMLTPPSQAAAHYAHVLSEKLRRANIRGPLAGNAMLPRGRTGLYLAFLIDQPWLGDELNPTAQGYRQSGAELVVVRRDAPVNAELAAAGDFQDLDGILFANQAEADVFPVRVYQRREARSP